MSSDTSSEDALILQEADKAKDPPDPETEEHQDHIQLEEKANLPGQANQSSKYDTENKQQDPIPRALSDWSQDVEYRRRSDRHERFMETRSLSPMSSNRQRHQRSSGTSNTYSRDNNKRSRYHDSLPCFRPASGFRDRPDAPTRSSSNHCYKSDIHNSQHKHNYRGRSCSLSPQRHNSNSRFNSLYRRGPLLETARLIKQELQVDRNGYTYICQRSQGQYNTNSSAYPRNRSSGMNHHYSNRNNRESKPATTQ